nr:hypothetical protein [Tanacetum cinerariifolium]
MFTTIKLVSRHQNTQQFGAMLPIELTNEDIKNSKAYKEYYEVATEAAPPKTKASVRNTKSSSDTTVPPPTAAGGTRLSTSAKGKQPAKASKKSSDEDDDDDVDEGSDDQDDDDAQDDDDDDDDDNDGDDLVHLKLSAHDEEAKDKESFDPIFQTPSHEENLMMKAMMTSVLFTGAVSSTPGIVYRYIDHQMNKDVKVAVQIQSDRLRNEAQAKNEDFLNKLDENIQKTINESSNSSKKSYVVAADLSELELKKILIEKIESNKSIHRSDEQRNLYKALVDAYECDKNILDTYGDTVTLKRRRDDADKDEEPFAGSDRGSKRRREGKEPESTSATKEKASKTTGKSTEGSKSHQKTISESASAEEPMQTTQDLEEPSHQEFETGAADDQPIVEASHHPKWFQKQTKPPTPDHTLTHELLAGPTYELMKGSCKSLVKLEFFLEKAYKVTTDQLDWNNPEGQQYPYNLLKPLPLIPNSRSRHVIPFDHFINNDLEFLRGGASSRKYTTSVIKTKAEDYGHIK